MKKGFTLVEMLVVMAVLSLVGAFILNIFTSSLRGSNKSQIIIVIKQNGQSVLEALDKTIRSADNVVCPASNDICIGSPPCKNLVVRSGGIYTRFRFIDPSPSPNPTVSGLIQQDSPTKQIDPATNQEETDPVFVNRICSQADPMPQATILTDTNLQAGVSVESGSFVRNKLPGFNDQVTVSFIVKPGPGVSQALAGQIDPVTFGTTIQLR